MYIWELPDWPRFHWDAARLQEPLGVAHRKEGLLLGNMARLGFYLKLTAEVEAITEEALKSSEIEGEMLNRESVRSSVARRLGVPDAALAPEDRKVEGIVSMTLDATKKYAGPLTRERLFGWHAALFPTGYSGLRRIRVGDWRDDASGPMQVLSGPIGREKVHYEAPPAKRVDAEMAAFVDWFEQPRTIDGILHAAVAHLWFVTIHPFDDGNGRIARAIADMALARSEESPRRFCSMSAKSASSGRATTRSSKPPRRATSTSPRGCTGSWLASIGRLTTRKSRLRPCSERPASGTPTPMRNSTTASGGCSTASWTALKES